MTLTPSTPQPTGTVTLVFTDIEGSTSLLGELGVEAYQTALAEHRRIVREAFRAESGYEVDYEGDSFFYAFRSASEAMTAVSEAMAALAEGPIRIRVGVHTGEPVVDPPKYVGLDVHKAARIMSAGNGGQVLLSGSTRELVEVDVRDLGKHRLKDFPESVSLFQLGSTSFPPLRTISNTNLPVPLSSFVGREREVEQVVSLLRDERARLVTLAGPGGTGKTRLSIEAAGELVSDFKAGVFWVGLAPIRDPALVEVAIAETLGAKQELAAHIADKQLLLLLDNLEQVIAAAPGLAALLQVCRNLCMLVTSREALRVDGEAVYPVPALVEEDATNLFCTRAGVDPDETVATLCGRLDNLPLALELAAARTTVLSLAQILERIGQRLDLFKGGRDADPRQQTLRATIAWSYDLLTDDEKRLFARLAVFQGGCTLETAEQVADADVDTLQALLDKSLLRRNDDRFWMLETIREYASEQLQASGEAQWARARHADHYVELSERAYSERFDRGLTWGRRLDAEHDNLRATLDYLHDHARLQHLQLAGALGWFWEARSHFAEGSRRLEQALDADTPIEAAALQARALAALGELDIMRGLNAAAMTRLEQALTLWRSVGDETESVDTEILLGWALFFGNESERALQQFEDSLDHARRLGHQGLVNRAMNGVCQELVARSDVERAEPLAQEFYNATRGTEDIWVMSSGHYLADCAMHRQDYARAQHYRIGALQEALHSGDVWQQNGEVMGLAFTAAGLGYHEDALHLEGAFDTKCKELGIPQSFAPFVEAWRERDLGSAHAALGKTRAEELFTEGQAMTWDQTIELALNRPATSS
jgi:predicted ATPase/class 3 adenylate cyclase